jgi:hypothetical protein
VRGKPETKELGRAIPFPVLILGCLAVIAVFGLVAWNVPKVIGKALGAGLATITHTATAVSGLPGTARPLFQRGGAPRADEEPQRNAASKREGSPSAAARGEGAVAPLRYMGIIRDSSGVRVCLADEGWVPVIAYKADGEVMLMDGRLAFEGPRGHVTPLESKEGGTPVAAH